MLTCLTRLREKPMKIDKHLFTRSTLATSLSFITVFGVLVFSHAEAATVSGGALTINLDRNALIAGVDLDNYPDNQTDTFPICCRPSIYVEEFFDSAAATSRTFTQLLGDNTPDLYDSVSDEISAVGLHFSVNSANPSPLPDGAGFHYNEKTTFNFNPSNLLGTASGQIGFGGVIRFRVDVDPPKNRTLMGDMILKYDPANEGFSPGQSGWTLINKIGFTTGAFDLFDVSTSLSGDTLALSGVLGLGDGFDHLGGIGDTRVGTFSFQTTVVPVPTAIWLFASGLAGLSAVGRSKRKARL